MIDFDSKDFWDKLDEHHGHVNRRYVLEIMRSLNEWGFLSEEGRKYLEKLITEDGNKNTKMP